MNNHFITHYYKYVVVGLCVEMCSTVPVVYTNVGEVVDESTIPADSEEVSEVVSGTVVTEDLLVLDTNMASTSVTNVSTGTPVVEVASPGIASITLEMETAAVDQEMTMNTAESAELDAGVESNQSARDIVTSSERTTEINNVDEADELRIPEDEEACRSGGWREYFMDLGECMRAVREGVMPY